MLIKGKGREGTCSLLLVFHSNSYYPQMRRWPEPERQAHTLPCPEECIALPTLCPPALSKSLCSLTKPQRMRFGPVPVSNSIWHDTYVVFCSGSSLSMSPPLHPRAVKLRSSPGTRWGCSSGCLSKRSHPANALCTQRGIESCDETSGEKSKINSRFTCVQFTSLNCFPPSSALSPSGKCSSKSTCWNLKRQMDFKCFKGRCKTKLSCNSSLATGTANTTKPYPHGGHLVSAVMSLWKQQGLKIKHSL